MNKIFGFFKTNENGYECNETNQSYQKRNHSSIDTLSTNMFLGDCPIYKFKTLYLKHFFKMLSLVQSVSLLHSVDIHGGVFSTKAMYFSASKNERYCAGWMLVFNTVSRKPDLR